MVFSSQVFVFIFLPVVFLLNTAVMAFASEKRPGFVRASNVLLLIASLVFYAWGEPVTVLLLIGEALFLTHYPNTDNLIMVLDKKSA